MFLKISQNSQENTRARVSFFLRSATLLKKRLWHRCFPRNFAKFLRTPSPTEHMWWLLRFLPCQKNIVCEWIQTLPETNHEIKQTFLLVSGIDVEKLGSFNVRLIRFMNNFYKHISRSSRLQMFFKIDALKSFGNFTGKHLSWGLFLKNLLAEDFQLY